MLTGADFEQCVKGIEDFHGAGRRFEKLAEIDGITIADDYAHHPRELEVTLKTAMNARFGRYSSPSPTQEQLYSLMTSSGCSRSRITA